MNIVNFYNKELPPEKMGVQQDLWLLKTQNAQISRQTKRPL